MPIVEKDDVVGDDVEKITDENDPTKVDVVISEDEIIEETVIPNCLKHVELESDEEVERKMLRFLRHEK